MTGPEHYAEAERLLAGRTLPTNEDDTKTYCVPATADDVAAAQVHATLALAAATALPTQRMLITDSLQGWFKAAAGVVPEDGA